MSWLIAQTWLLLLTAFLLGSAAAWLVVRVVLSRFKVVLLRLKGVS
jgi:hypothetical protein